MHQALLPQLLQATAASIHLLAAAPRAVCQSAALRRCLGLCLRLGNALNRGTARGDAAGFDVSVLPSLAAVKATGGGKGGEGGKGVCDSLLHCVAAEMARDAAEDAEGAGDPGDAGTTGEVEGVGVVEEAAAAGGEGPAAALQAELAPLLSEAEAVRPLCSDPNPSPSRNLNPNPSPGPSPSPSPDPNPNPNPNQAIDAFFDEGSPVQRVYWFGATDYGGGTVNNFLTDVRTRACADHALRQVHTRAQQLAHMHMHTCTRTRT